MVKKKAQNLPLEERKKLILPGDPNFSIAKQCTLNGVSRSSFYYESRPESQKNLILMREIDELYTAHPYFGKRSMSEYLKAKGLSCGVDLSRTLMKKLGIEAIYRKPNLSQPKIGHQVFPYLLRGVKITHPNHVWSTDITYIRMRNGFLYLTAVIDWYSRYILSWKLSNSLDGFFCREVVLEALRKFKHPDFFNTDQGSQYTSDEFVNILIKEGVKVSMDGRGRALDNVWIERFWRTLKYEDVYLKDYVDGVDLHRGLSLYFEFYCTKRLHSGLDYKTPQSVYFS